MSEPTSDKYDKHQSDTKNKSDNIKHNNNVPEATSNPICKEEIKEFKIMPYERNKREDHQSITSVQTTSVIHNKTHVVLFFYISSLFVFKHPSYL